TYRLTPKARRLLHRQDGDGRSTQRQPSAAFHDHVLAIGDVFVTLVEADRRGAIELLEFQAEPRCWRRFSGPGGASVALRPDAFVRVGAGDYEHLAFLEVDRGTESIAALARKLDAFRAYAADGAEQQRFGVFPRVVFLAVDQ